MPRHLLWATSVEVRPRVPLEVASKPGTRGRADAPTRRGNVEAVRAIEYSVTGEPDVLTLVDREVRDPGPGEVRVRIHRSGVNPTDWKSRRGGEAGTPVDPPQVPNQDGSGVVDA